MVRAVLFTVVKRTLGAFLLMGLLTVVACDRGPKVQPPSSGSSGLDDSFGHGGVSLLAEVNATATALLVDDGGAVAGGAVYESELRSKWLVVRFSQRGQVSEAFSRTARAINDRRGSVIALARSANGGVYVAGELVTDDSASRLAVSRLHEDGRLDETFGHQGTVLPNQVRRPSELSALYEDKAGRAIIAYESHEGRVGLLRLTLEGVPDTTFGSDGYVAPPVTGAVFDQDARRRVLVVGRNPSGDAVTVIRYLPDGSEDSSFGRGGRVSLSAKAIRADLRRVGAPVAHILATTKGFLLGVFQNPGTDYRHYFSHFDSQGKPYPGFGDDQFVVGDVARINDLVARDKLILVGDNPGGTGLVQRRQMDGAIDESFHGGTVLVQPSRFENVIEEVDVTNEHVFVAGSTSDDTTASRLFVARMRA